MSTSNFLLKNLDPNKSGFRAPGFSWDDYIKYRPAYPNSFYERIYNYHASHSSSWAVAHDTGAGAGIASEVIAQKFDHVHVSDPGPEYVQIAEKRLKSLVFPASKFSFHTEGAENSSVASDSVDLLLITEAIQWCDIPVAMKEFARQLKKGGTVAITFYGPPMFRNPKASEVWRAVLQHYMTRLTALGGVYERVAINSGNGLSAVPFDAEYYEPGAKRIFVDTNGDFDSLCFIPRDAPDRTLPSDERIFIEDDGDWIKEADMDYRRGACKSFLTSMKEDEFNKFWPDVEEALGGKGDKCELIWPNLQFLATRA